MEITATEIERILLALLESEEAEESLEEIVESDGVPSLSFEAESFEDSGLLSRERGVVLKIRNASLKSNVDFEGAEFQITILRTK